MAFQIVLQQTNQYLDLSDKTDIAKTAGWFNLKELSARSGEFSNVFTIPASAKNRLILKLDMPAPNNSLAYNKVPVTILENGITFLQGFMQVISDNEQGIEITVQGNYTDWLNTVSEAELKDLPALPISVAVDLTIPVNQPQLFDPVDERGFVYCLMSDGGVMQYHAGYWYGGDWTPCIWVKRALTDIFKAAGYNVTFPNFGANSAFERLIIPVLERESYGQDFIDRRKCELSDATGALGGIGASAVVDWATFFTSPSIIQGADQPYNGDGSYLGSYQSYGGVEVDLQVKFKWSMANGISQTYDLVISNISPSYGSKQIIRLGVIQTNSGGGVISEDINQTYKVVVPAGSGLQLEVVRTGGAAPDIYYIEPDSDGDCFMKFMPTGRSIKIEDAPFSFTNNYGDLVTFTNSLYNRVDLKQKELIKYVCTAFGMYPVTEGDTVTFKLLDGAINNSEPKPDISKFINLDKYSRSFELPEAQSNLFQYDNDSSDSFLSVTNPLTTVAEGAIVSNNKTLPMVKTVYTAPFSYTVQATTIPYRNWDNNTRPFRGIDFPLLVAGKFKPDYYRVNNNRFRRYEPYNGGASVSYFDGDVIQYMGNYLIMQDASVSGTAIDNRVGVGTWQFIEYENINQGGGNSKPRIALYADVEYPITYQVYGLDGVAISSVFDKLRLAFTDQTKLKEFWDITTDTSFATEVTDLTTLSFAELIAQFSKIITGAYQYSEVYRLEALLTNTQVDELVNSTGVFVDVGNQKLKLTGVFWLNVIDQFRGSGKPVVIELVRL